MENPHVISENAHALMPRRRTETGADPILIVYAGQPDPTDLSAFTIEFDLDKIRHTARFKLNAGDMVDLVSITPPL